MNPTSICITQNEYASGTLATTTQYCRNATQAHVNFILTGVYFYLGFYFIWELSKYLKKKHER